MASIKGDVTNWRSSDTYRYSVKELVEQFKNYLETKDVLVVPLQGSDFESVPYGFYTVGLTLKGLPELFASGIDSKSREFTYIANNLLSQIPRLFDDPTGVHVQTWAGILTNILHQDTLGHYFTVQPIDPERFMYGQGLGLRYWAEATGVTPKVVQIVWRESLQDMFPIVSNATQQLIDYVPFGVKPAKNIMELIPNEDA